MDEYSVFCAFTVVRGQGCGREGCGNHMSTAVVGGLGWQDAVQTPINTSTVVVLMLSVQTIVWAQLNGSDTQATSTLLASGNHENFLPRFLTVCTTSCRDTLI